MSPIRNRSRGGFVPVCALIALMAAAFGVAPAQAQVPAPVPFSNANFRAYAHGVVAHTDELQTGTTRIQDTEVAMSSAGTDSQGLVAKLNEMLRPTIPARPAKKTYGRGTGLEVGVNSGVSGPNTLVLAGNAETDAPPSTGPVTEEVGPVDADPAAWASVVRGQAQSRYLADRCILGSDISYGLGYAADAQLVDAGGNTGGELDAPLVALDHPDPDRSVSQSYSHNWMIPQVDAAGNKVGNAFGVASEVRMTIAPVTLLSGSANQTTIEFLGEWVLRVQSGGLPGTSVVHYGPGSASPDTPIIRILNAAGNVTDVLDFQTVFGGTGFTLPTNPVIELAIGEDPRAIGGNAASQPTISANGTVTSAAVDVLRVKVLEQVDGNGAVTLHAADIRVGHMEVSATTPVGGIDCPLNIKKTATKTKILADDTFATPITVTNDTFCDLTNVKITDTITTTKDSRFKVISTDPTANTVPSGDKLQTGVVEWTGLGPIKPGDSLTVTVTVQGLLNDPNKAFKLGELVGTIEDIAQGTATLANCENGTTSATTVVSVSINGVTPPVVVIVEPKVPTTGAPTLPTLMTGIALAGTSLETIRRVRR